MMSAAIRSPAAQAVAVAVAGAGSGAAEAMSTLARSTFRAARVHEFGGPEKFVVDTDIPIPTPSDNEVVVAMAYAGVNPVDTYLRAGAYAVKPALPFTPGKDGSGTVALVGAGVSHVKEGDRVFLSAAKTGTYAEYAVAAAGGVHKLPEHVGLKEGAAIGVPVFTAYRALFTRTKARPGEWVLIHGASGAVGTAAVQLAAHHGCKVIGTAGTEKGLAMLKSLGCDVVANHRSGDVKEKVMEATGGSGVDVIIEMLADANLGNDLPMLARGGRVGIVGSRGEVTINPRDLMQREATVTGVMLAHCTPADWDEGLAYVAKQLQARTLTPVIGEEYTLEQAGEAHIAVIDHSSGSSGKIVLKCD